MADDILLQEGAETPRFDTLSYYDKTEPRGDDWFYFPKIENHRGQAGHHFDTSQFDLNSYLQNFTEFHALPGFSGFQGNFEHNRAAILNAGGYKVVLSGVGGDEFLGGIPNPSTQLAELITQCKISELSNLLIAWSLVKRKPCTHLLWQALLDLLPCPINRYFLKQAKVEPWVNGQFAKRVKRALGSVEQNQENAISPLRRSCMGGIFLMARKLAKWSSLCSRAEEDRYPYVDQGLLEFIVSIPATQLLRPHERRSLMRRSLIGLVPPEILARKTKQVGARTPVIGLQQSAERIYQLFDSPISSHLGYVERATLLEALRDARNGKDVQLVRIFRAIALELWLRHLVSRRLIANTVRLTLRRDFKQFCQVASE